MRKTAELAAVESIVRNSADAEEAVNVELQDDPCGVDSDTSDAYLALEVATRLCVVASVQQMADEGMDDDERNCKGLQCKEFQPLLKKRKKINMNIKNNILQKKCKIRNLPKGANVVIAG